MSKPKLVYIAGPYRGANAWEVEQNIQRAEAIAADVFETGHYPLCVHTMYRNFDGTMTGQFWLDATMEMMRRCDVVLILPHSDNSEGTRGEMLEAMARRIPILHYRLAKDRLGQEIGEA